ncbi:hypothetical protein [Succinivibrio dextrinosolvens]|jgi:hypothetical protein|uniref:hypothetical protein n=1 Tax=Succinivibrio dextrinosolvens TaxID=83771 RepID=UPI00241F96CF|nr:hypothetical protein [Succinivibrio dextrinosolvens]MBE6423098.1 hypothetical protein [Succinivibrio dextrinosolvens]
MKKITQRALSLCLLGIFAIQTIVNAAEVLVDSGQRQTVLERTKQYAGKIDAVDIRANATINFQKNLKVHSGGKVSGSNSKCGGFTSSICGVPCCGEKECSTVCTANHSVAHGNSCLSEYTKSWCGMSCCGKEDCDRVCYNYRASTVSTENCGGYIRTATGESCCGLEDCRQKNCGSYTSTITADYGNEEKCCGKQNCEDVKCDYSHSTEVISGGTAKCCGTKDCYAKYCEEQTSVDSKVYPDKKNLQCCGKENCHQVECDGYTQTNTPSGVRACCGYEDCRNKECEYQRTAHTADGKEVACCGYQECLTKSLPRDYQQPTQKCETQTKYCMHKYGCKIYGSGTTGWYESDCKYETYACGTETNCCNTYENVQHKVAFNVQVIPDCKETQCYMSTTGRWCQYACTYKKQTTCNTKPQHVCLKQSQRSKYLNGSYPGMMTYCEVWSDGSAPSCLSNCY